MSVLIDSLKKQNSMLQSEVERFAVAVDDLSAKLAGACNRLRPHDPEFVATILGQEVPPSEMTPIAEGNEGQAETA